MAPSLRSWKASISVLLVIVTSACLAEVFAVTRREDVSALNELSKTWSALKGLNWNGDPCDDLWTGIVCDDNNTTVTSLSLDNRQLQGVLPSAIGKLTSLTILELSRNPDLGGQLPDELGNLINLQYLSLQWCSFNGPIPPVFGNLAKLTFLAFTGNNLSGSIPNTFGNFTQINWLDLSTNAITGLIPVSSSPGSNGIGLNNMTFVKHLHLNNNSLSGSIPQEIFSLPNLIHLILDHNQMQFSIPREIGNSKNLTVLRLDNNQFEGLIPQDLSAVSTLVNVNLRQNKFSGILPDLSGLTNLQLLDVSLNNFDPQPFPPWLVSMTHMTTLNLAQASIQGQIPFEIFNLSPLESLNFSRNQINGTLEFVGDTGQDLQVLDLTNNDINGFVGQPINRGRVLKALRIMLEGNPLCFNTFISVPRLSCGAGNLGSSDYWPMEYGSCSGTNCRKHGKTLNPKNCTCAYPLQVTLILTAPHFLNLTHERAASLEQEFAEKLTQGGFVKLDPKQVVITFGVQTADTRYELDLLFFPLLGSSLSSSDRSKIVNALSQRRVTLFEGPYEVPWNGFSDEDGHHLHLSIGAILGIVVGCIIVALALIAFAIREKRRADQAVFSHPFALWGGGSDEFGEAPKLKGARWFSLAELKDCTDNWNKQNKIGEGGYGEVYRGILKTGDVVAIKRASEGSLQGAAEFKNEIELLSRVHHRNLVGLLGFCYESGEQALIYEFMSNGTLREHLLGTLSVLTWEERLCIALGSARGLAYLHEHANPPIIHRDIKSANILLNERNVPKVADFGLSKLLPDEGEKKVYTANIKGTMGYLDPEYYTKRQLTDKSDVYSFGIVLLEILTSKAPIERGKFIVREIQLALDKGGMAALHPLLDPILQIVSNEEIEAFLKLALTCVEESSVNRQCMADVVKELEALGAYSDVNSKPDMDYEAKKFFSDTDALFPLKPADDDDQSFHYSGVFGVSTTVQPK